MLRTHHEYTEGKGLPILDMAEALLAFGSYFKIPPYLGREMSIHLKIANIIFLAIAGIWGVSTMSQALHILFLILTTIQR